MRKNTLFQLESDDIDTIFANVDEMYRLHQRIITCLQMLDSYQRECIGSYFVTYVRVAHG